MKPMPTILRHALHSILLLAVCSTQATAQNYPITLQVQLIPPYSAFLSDYLQKSIISFTNQGQQPLDVYIRGRFENDRGQFVETSPYSYSNIPIHVPGMQTVVVQGSQLDEGYLDVNHLNTNLADEDYDNFRRLGQLPEGYYTFCIYAYRRDANGNYQPVSDPLAMGSCFPFPITHVLPPVITTPVTGDTITPSPTQQVNISWTSPMGFNPGTITVYDLYLVKVLPGEDPQVSMGNAVQYNAGIFIKQPGIMMNNFQFTNLGGFNLEEGGTYALMVQARDPNGQTAFENNGRSVTETFVYGGTVPPAGTVTAITEGSCSCAVDVAALDQANNTASLAPGGSFTMATLTVKIGTVSVSGGLASGTGTVLVKQVPVQVTFSGVAVNNAGVAIAGSAKAKTDNAFGFLENNPLPSISTSDYDSFMDRISDYNLDAVLAGAGVMLPFGLHTFGAPDAVNVAVVALDITPAKATYDAIAAVQLADANHVLSLLAKDVCFSNTSVMCGDALFVLAQDLELPGIQLKLHGFRSEAEPGTFVRYANGELTKFHIRAEYAFPAALITKLDGGAATALLDADATSWSDWTATVSLDPFRLPALDGVEFRLAQGAFYDHSTLRNPTGMPSSFSEPLLAEKNAEIGTALWTGFYLPTATVTLPAIVSAGPQGSGRIEIGATHLLVDGSGLSGMVGATNVISIGNGSLGGWYCSLDHVGITLLNSSFIGGGMNGQVILPFSDKDKQASRINYSCTLSADNNGGGLTYQFIAQQQQDIDFSAWWARININHCSIEVSNRSGSTVASADLSGKLSIQGEVEGYRVGLDLITIEHLVVSTAAPHVKVQNAVAGLSSPQHFMADFPISNLSVEPKINGSNVGLQIGFKMTLSDLANQILPDASSKFTVSANVLGGTRPVWQRADFHLDQVCINGDLAGVVHIKQGCIDFFKNDAVFGDGISGFLRASFAGLDAVEVDCTAKFGHTSFNYWYFDASVTIHPGIPVAPGISINGFGGGAWYNLVRTGNGNLAAKDYFNNMAQYQLGAYRPQSGTLGFKAKLGISTSDGYIFSGYGEVGITFNTAGPISVNALDGTFYAQVLKATEGLAQDAKAPVQGIIEWHAGIADRVFSLDGRVDLNFPWGGTPIVSGSGTFAFLADVGNQNYYIKFGDPAEERIKVSILDLATLKGYFMAGNAIDAAIPDPDPAIVDVSKLSNYHRVQYDPEAGGMVMGASFQFRKHIPFTIFFAEVELGAGFDVSFARHTRGCEDHPAPPGVNGWYAIGQVYAHVSGALGVEVDLPMVGHKKVKAAEIGASTLLQGGLPDPYWFDGYLYLYYNALGGLLEGHVNFKVSIGDKCVPEQQVFTMPLISELKPADGSTKIPLNASPEAVFNYPVERSFEIVVMDADGIQVARDFQLKLLECKATDLESGKVYADYFNFTSYPVFLDDRHTDLALDPQDALKSQTRYRFDVAVKAQERNGSNWVDCTYDGSPVRESSSVTFKTGDCKLDEIIADPGSRLASFPFPNQRFFLQGDSRKGAVILDKAYECAQAPNENYDLLVRFTPADGSGPKEVPIVLNGSRYLTFDIPALPNATIVRTEVIKRRKFSSGDSFQIMSNSVLATGINQHFAQMIRPLQVGGGQGFSTGSMTAMPSATMISQQAGGTPSFNTGFTLPASAVAQLAGISGTAQSSAPQLIVHTPSIWTGLAQLMTNQKLRLTDRILDEVLYKYHFRTSRYNTLAAKMNSFSYSSPIGSSWEFYSIKASMAEGFDAFDINGFVSNRYHNGNRVYFSVPLVTFREARQGNNWADQYARPCIYEQYRNAMVSIWDVRYAHGVSYQEIQRAGLECDPWSDCFPRRPILIQSIEPSLSPGEIFQAYPINLISPAPRGSWLY